jgi:hypothetical protein
VPKKKTTTRINQIPSAKIFQKHIIFTVRKPIRNKFAFTRAGRKKTIQHHMRCDILKHPYLFFGVAPSPSSSPKGDPRPSSSSHAFFDDEAFFSDGVLDMVNPLELRFGGVVSFYVLRKDAVIIPAIIHGCR